MDYTKLAALQTAAQDLSIAIWSDTAPSLAKGYCFNAKGAPICAMGHVLYNAGFRAKGRHNCANPLMIEFLGDNNWVLSRAVDAVEDANDRDNSALVAGALNHLAAVCNDILVGWN